MVFGGVTQHGDQLLLGGGLAGNPGVDIEGGGGEPGQLATLTATDPDAALITHGSIADAGVVVAGSLSVTKAHCHGEVAVGQLGAAYRGGAGGEQAADPEISFGVAGAGGLPVLAATQ